MIYGVGIDIIDIRRIQRVFEKYGSKFKKKCFHDNEISKADNRYKWIETYSKRYAAKEACAKALGTGLAKGVFWKDIEIINDKFGKPEIVLHNNAKQLVEKFNNKYKIEVSLSDEKEFAIANVIIFV